jgi:hypothetical protein
MEFIKVTVPGNASDDIDVLINGEKNGKAGETITLGGSGFVIISVDLSGAEEKTVDVNNTTAVNPMHIEVIV